MSEPIPDDAVDPSDPATPQDVEGADPQRLHLHMPVDVRSVSLAVLAVLGIIFALHWASAVFIPLFLGLTCSYALAPVVDRLERMRVPRAIGAAFLLIGIVGGMGWTVYSLSDDATGVIESLPDAAP